MCENVQMCVAKRYDIMSGEVKCVDDVACVVNMCVSTQLDSYIVMFE